MAASESTALKTKLVDQHRKFALEYFGGENAGNGTKSYMKIFPKAKYGTAAVEASVLLKSPELREFLESLHEEARDGVLADVRPWIELAGEAQAVVLLTSRGKLRSRLCLDAAKEILDRAFGRPTERIEHQHRDERQITRALFALGVRQQPTD